MRAPRPRLPSTLAALLGALIAGGCGAGETTPDAQGPDAPEYVPPPRPDTRIETDFAWEWGDISIDERGEPDPIAVARWRRERNDAVQRCLRRDPPALEHAIELLEEILNRLPQSSQDRGLLAQVLFMDARYWWRCADVIAYEMSWIVNKNTIRNPEGPPHRSLTEGEAEDLVEDMRPYLERANRQLRVVARQSLDNFKRYRQQRPDDKAVYDFYWKLHFYLQNYEQSLRWLETVIHEMDMAELPASDPTRRDYEKVRTEIEDYLAERRLYGEEGESRPRRLIESLDEGPGRGDFRYQ